MTNKENQATFDNILIKFSKTHQNNNKKLTAAVLNTPIGELLTVGDEKFIYILQVLNDDSISSVKRVVDHTKSYITSGRTKTIDLLDRELQNYFDGKLEDFTTPIQMFGTNFQIHVWNQLRKIPFGKQISYAQLAENVKKETNSTASAPVRAVGTANGANKIMILIPCHRVINKNGNLGGFSCGIEKKQLLLDLENKIS